MKSEPKYSNTFKNSSHFLSLDSVFVTFVLCTLFSLRLESERLVSG